MTTQVLDTIGISLTMIGAILIAVDVTRQFNGEKHYISAGVSRADYLGSPVIVEQNAYETEEYKRWKQINKRLMLCGLSGILIGGIVQIIARWI